MKEKALSCPRGGDVINPSIPQAIMLAVMKKLKYDDEYNFENEVNRTAGVLSTVLF